MNRVKKLYFGLLLISVCIVTTLYFSYAFFASKNEEHGKLNIVAGTLNYKMESNELENNKITITANSYKNLTVNITSLNDISSKYQLFYSFITALSSEEKSRFYVEYSYLSDNTSYQVIESGKNSEVNITIINNTGKDVEIEFGVTGGFTNQEIKLNSTQLAINSFNHLIDYSGNNYYGTFINGANIIYDEAEKMYALNFDGTDDYVDIVDLPETIDWANGFTIEFEAKWDALNAWSRIFDFGEPTNYTLAFYNSNTRSTGTFVYSVGTTYSHLESSEIEMVNKMAKYKVDMVKTDAGYDLSIYQDDVVIGTQSLTTGHITNITRTEAYLGKARDGQSYFDGKIYNLKITEADGDVVLYYNPSQKYKITNLVANSSFEDGTNSWTKVSGTITADYASSGSHSLYILDEDSTADSYWSGQTLKSSIPTNHMVYLSMEAYSVSVTTGYSVLIAVGNASNNYFLTPYTTATNSFVRKSNYGKAPSEILRVQTGSSVGGIGEAYYDSILVVDITKSFGLGNEPTQEWIDKNINWFDDTLEVYKYDF